MRTFFFATVIVGIFFVAASFVLPTVIGGKRSWTDEQAKSLSQATAEMHRLVHETSDAANAARIATKTAAGKSATPAPQSATAPASDTDLAIAKAERLSQEMAAAQERYSRQRAALDQARAAGQTTALVMRYLGVAAAAIGLFGCATTQPTANPHEHDEKTHLLE